MIPRFSNRANTSPIRPRSTPSGLIKTNDQNLFFRHYWMDKPRIKENKKGFSLEEESNNLMNVIKNTVKIDWEVVV